MRVLLIDIDSKIPNLALKKIEKYHSDRGDEVIWNYELMAYQCDKIYVSCVFTENKNKCEQWEGIAEIGGTGYSLKTALPLEIESIKPRINWGFTTRGCIRKCSFCFVPEKEGKIHIVGDLLDLWDGQSSKVIVMDNNILALPEHFKFICQQARENNIEIDFNQGLDHRLLTDDICHELKQTKITQYRFAYDHPVYHDSVREAIDVLKRFKIQALWYVLCGFNTTIEEDEFRINYINATGQRAYCMKHSNVKDKWLYTQLARWANCPLWRNGISFSDFLTKQKPVTIALK